MGNTYVSIFGAAMSALDIFEQDKGPVCYGTQGDWCYISLFYDKLVKNSHVSFSGTRFLGCTSQKVWIARSSVWCLETSIEPSIPKVGSIPSGLPCTTGQRPHVDSPITAKINYSTAVF